MFDAAPLPGQNRRPLPPAQPPADGVPRPRTPMSTQERQTKADRPGKQRDAFFDNAKYLAIAFVAMGHAWEPLKGDSRTVETLYTIVYTFHMPAFIIISGFFSRSFDMRPDRLKRLITGVAVPYVLFETAYSVFRNLVTGSDDGVTLLDPWYLTWFLVALFVWRLTTPIWKLVRWPLPLALGIAMLATVTPELGNDFDVQRVLQFLPYFVLGLSMKPEHFHLVRRRSVRIASVPVLAAAFVVGWWAAPAHERRLVLPPRRRSGAGRPLVVRADDDAGPDGLLAGADGLLLRLGAAAEDVVHRPGLGHLYGYLLHGFLKKYGDYQAGSSTPGCTARPARSP